MKFDAPKLSFAQKPEAAATGNERMPAAQRIKIARRRQLMMAEAEAVLAELPAPGEALHALMTGRYDLMHVLLVLLGKWGVCDHLRIATLAFSSKNVEEIGKLLDAKSVKNAGIVCSLYFKDNRKADYAAALAELTKHGGRLAATRNHCKVVALHLADGSKYSLEGSSNLRSNSNREQFCLVNDAGLHDWHAAWIDEALVTHGEVVEG